MKENSKNHFGLTEENVEAQALNEEVVANAATSVNNVPACEGEVDEQPSACDEPAEVEHSTYNGADHTQQPLMKERVVHTLKKKILKKVLVIKSNRKDPRQTKVKQRSCRKYGMLVSALFADATPAYDAGYVLVNPITGEVVKNREETFGKLVIMEGNTRFWAWLAEVERIEKEKRKSKGRAMTKTRSPSSTHSVIVTSPIPRCSRTSIATSILTMCPLELLTWLVMSWTPRERMRLLLLTPARSIAASPPRLQALPQKVRK